jgi:hypothetical protein
MGAERSGAHSGASGQPGLLERADLRRAVQGHRFGSGYARPVPGSSPISGAPSTEVVEADSERALEPAEEGRASRSWTRPLRHPVLDAVTPRRALVAVCLVFVTLSLGVALATPWGEANDEADHVRNAAAIASGSMYRIEPGVQLEAFEPPLYYFGLAAELQLLGNDMNPDIWEYTLDRHDQPTEAASQRLFTLLRLPSILLGLTTILLAAAIARRVSRDPWTPVVAAACLALIPKFVFLSGVVNNDNLSITLGAAATLVAVVLVTADLDRRRQLQAVTALGVLAGLMAITKFTSLPLLAAWVTALVLARLRARLLAFVLFGVGFVVTSGWWFWWNTTQYGDPLSRSATEDHLNRFQLFPLTGAMTAHRAFVDVPKQLWYQFFYTSGFNQFRWSHWWYVPFWIVLLIGLVGLVVTLPRSGRRALAVLGVISAMSLVTVWIAVLDTTMIQARHAFAGLPAIAVLVALGYERIRIPVVARFALPVMGFVGALVALRQDVFGEYLG